METESDSNTEIKKLHSEPTSKPSKEKEEEVEVKEETNTVRIIKEIITWIFKYAISTLMGFIFGYAMEKSKVYEPKAIRQQMIFQKFIMLKMFLAAFGTSTISIFFVALLFKKRYDRVLQSAKDALKNKSVLTLVTGGLLIGVGMQISGACPGMVLVQLGAGVPWSYITLIGALVGALIHGLLNNILTKDTKPNLIVSKALFEIIPIHPIILRIAFILLLAIIVFLLEFFIPWTNEYSNPILNNSSNILIYRAWPPYVCGIILGSLQFVSLLSLEKSLGASSFFSTFAGLPICTKYLQNIFPYLAKFRTGLQNWLSLAFTVGAIIGAFASSYPAGVFGTAVGVHPYNAFLGGFIMVFGARCAGGCTSGHGISGSSHQLIGSFITTASMFGGAIILAFYAYTNDFFFN